MSRSPSSVFVGNLTWSTTNEQLLAFANQIGNVASVEVKRHDDTSRSKGWGLITFYDNDSAERAVAVLNTAELNGRAVHVRLDRTSAETVETTHNIFVGNLPWVLTNNELLSMFQGFQPADCQILTNMYGKSRGFAIVKFHTETDAMRAIDVMHMTDVRGRNIECRFDRGPGKGDDASTRTSVFVGKIGLEVTDDVLASIFTHIGGVVSAKVNRYSDGKSKGWGIVRFADAFTAKAAVDTMNGVSSSPGMTGMKVRLDRK